MRHMVGVKPDLITFPATECRRPLAGGYTS